MKTKKLLIFKKVLNQKQDNYEDYKSSQHPFNPFIVFSMPGLILFIGEGDYEYKSNEKEYGKN
ncbi:hypothetical protein [Flagellimonas sp.]|uniref:hypothetical protein n=1 Tax=Flagellimonas sp. TaxID=2058762 RepID=UPI003BAEDF33